MTRWKYAESRIAAQLGGHRIPITGRARGDRPDVESAEYDWLSIEVKNREVVPHWILNGIAQARAAVRGDQLPIVIVHKVGTQYRDSLVVLRMADFMDWFGASPNIQEDEK